MSEQKELMGLATFGLALMLTLGAGCGGRTAAHPVLARAASGEGPPLVLPQWVLVPAGSGHLKALPRGSEDLGGFGLHTEDHPVGVSRPLCVMARALTVAEHQALMGQLPEGNCDRLSRRDSRSPRGEPAGASRCDWDAPALVRDLESALKVADALSRSYGFSVAGGGVRLMREGEWEWAASGAGETELWSGTDDRIALFMFYSDQPEAFDRGPTGTARHWPNALGLYDMTGGAPELVLVEDRGAPGKVAVIKGGRAFESPSHSGQHSAPTIAARGAPGGAMALRFATDTLAVCAPPG